MQNKTFSFSILALFGFLMMVIHTPSSYAISNAAPFNCDLQYGSGAPTDFNTYLGIGCIPTAAVEPVDGQLCFDDGLVVREASDAATAFCVPRSNIEGIAADVQANNWKGFNALRGTIDKSCRDNSYCHNGGSSAPCILSAGDLDGCFGKNRGVNCNGSCSGCIANHTYCGDPGDVCQLNYIGPGLQVGDVPGPGEFTCASIGRDVDVCTGACSDCPSGTTPSGDPDKAGSCVTYASRFEEIFELGLTAIGGPFSDASANNADFYGVYDYTDSAPLTYAGLLGTDVEHYIGAMQDVFFKTDVAETLNWASDSIPPAITNLITNSVNNNYILCDGTSSVDPASADAACPGAMVCSAGGLCYDPARGVGSSCAANGASDCDLGLVCGDDLLCADPADPNGELVQCTDDTDCNNPATCVNGFCHDQTSGIGNSCASGPYAAGNDGNCAAGLVCGAGDICTVSGDSPIAELAFAGITTAKYDTALVVPYSDANSVCATHYVGSHVCSSDEVLKLYNSNNDSILTATGYGIVTAGPPGFTARADDCQGFTVKNRINGERTYMRWWDLDNDFGAMSECGNDLMGFLCCK